MPIHVSCGSSCSAVDAPMTHALSTAPREHGRRASARDTVSAPTHWRQRVAHGGGAHAWITHYQCVPRVSSRVTLMMVMVLELMVIRDSHRR